MSAFAHIAQWIEAIGRTILHLFNGLPKKIRGFGFFILFVGESLAQPVVGKVRWNLMLQQMKMIGVRSSFIVTLTGTFTGMVMALQTGRAFALFQAQTLSGAVTTLAIVKELGPVLASLMITARSGSAMAAQLGTMQVSQQIDALISMGVNPKGYLVAPRVIACVIVTPMLTAMFDFMGILGSYVVGVWMLNIDAATFVDKIVLYTENADLIEGFFKSGVFALILSSISCYKGFFTHGGAEGVGRSTTEAVVLSSVSILVFDYFLTALLF